ncbi:MAG: hypothetical protein EBT54_00380 [Betaproteobacteria bacterium]|nr:hypothetical protein [Betaproteobacteria bacterium]
MTTPAGNWRSCPPTAIADRWEPGPANSARATGAWSLKPGEAASDQGWSVRIYVKPFMAWVWIACLMMAIGGGTTLFDRRYRLRRAAAPATDAASASSPAQA